MKVPTRIFNTSKLKASGIKMGDVIEVNGYCATVVQRTNLGLIPCHTFTLYKTCNTSHFRLTTSRYYVGYSLYPSRNTDDGHCVGLHGYGAGTDYVKFLAEMFEAWHPYMLGKEQHIVHRAESRELSKAA